ncbi:MAG TPA: pilus assembly protein TadG-related protein, partial [Acidimicrobiia bacterium]
MFVIGHSRRRAPVRRGHESEGGFILVWFGLMLIALLSITALAVESNHWAHESRRVQKAADAAALGGSVFMPQNLGNIAYTTARTLATENGFTDGVNGVSV